MSSRIKVLAIISLTVGLCEAAADAICKNSPMPRDHAAVGEFNSPECEDGGNRDFHFDSRLQPSVSKFVSTGDLSCIRFHFKAPDVPSWAASGAKEPRFSPFRSTLSDTSPVNALRRPNCFRLPAEPTLLAAVKPPSAAPSQQTGSS